MNYKDYLTNLISGLGIEKELIEISVPPKEGMGDYCLPCFKIKVDNLNNPNEKEDAEKFLNSKWCDNMLDGMGMNFTGETILKRAATLNS